MDIYLATARRLIATAKFVSVRLDRRTARHYDRYIVAIEQALLQNAGSADSAASAMNAIMDAVNWRLLEDTSLGAKVTGKLSDEIRARRMAIEHAFDIVLSERRFEGVSPGSPLDSVERNLAKILVDSHIETISKNL